MRTNDTDRCSFSFYHFLLSALLPLSPFSLFVIYSLPSPPSSWQSVFYIYIYIYICSLSDLRQVIRWRRCIVTSTVVITHVCKVRHDKHSVKGCRNMYRELSVDMHLTVHTATRLYILLHEMRIYKSSTTTGHSSQEVLVNIKKFSFEI
jgi:hypothetical protein